MASVARRQPQTCPWCDKRMTAGNGCTESRIYVYKDGQEIDAKRLKFGEETRFKDPIKPGEICHDCNVMTGQYHHVGCDMEECPQCHNQLVSCGCESAPEVVGGN